MNGRGDADVAVRPASAGDLDRLRALLDQLGYPLTRAELARRVALVEDDPGHLLLVAAGSGGEVAGLLHAYARPSIEKPPEVTIQAMVVDETQRSAGIGATLLQSAENWARVRGYDHMGVHTQTKRERARAFYERNGFSEVARSVLYRRRLAR